MKLLLLTFFVSIFCIANAQHQQAPKGASNYLFKTRVESKLDGGMECKLFLSLKKIKSKKDGESLYELTVNNINYKEDRGDIHFSTYNLDSNKNLNRSTEMIPYFYFLNRPILLTVNKGRMQLDSVQVSNDIKAQLSAWCIKENDEAHILSNTFHEINIICQRLFFPNTLNVSLSSTKSFKDSISGKRYAIKKVSNGNFLLSSLDTSTKYKDEHTVTINKKSLQIKEDVRLSNFLYDVNNKSSEAFRIEHLNAIKEVPICLIDSAYINMIVKGSYWSSALNNELGLDSTKLLRYIKHYEPAFSNDKNFVATKLDGLQRLDDYEIYSQALKSTPSMLLAGTHHVNNKLYQNGISDKDFDELVPMLNEQSLYSWLQHVFSQSMLRDDYTTTKLNTIKLVNNFSEKERIAAFPLYLWTNALNNKNNVDSLKMYANKFTELNNDYWNKGNAGRYALLVYKMLPTKETPFANSYLEKIIKRIIPLYEDSLNDKRFIQKAHLAYAYYLQYQELLKTDSSKALAQLEHAALYSPQNNKEKAHDSFYDRVFLKSKESYKDEYLKILAATGKKDIALQKYIEEFLGNQGSSFKGLKTFYEKNYDPKTFAHFFNTDIIPKLPDAIEFKLTDMKDQSFSFASLKGKWTIIDFWGTWCGPCVAEMPKLNKYNEQLKQKQDGNINFLSIACRDTKEKVSAFLSKNKYSIPVLMSDEKVEKDYKVPGYPSKFIITPTGKLISTEFGFDWQSLINELAKL